MCFNDKRNDKLKNCFNFFTKKREMYEKLLKNEALFQCAKYWEK